MGRGPVDFSAEMKRIFGFLLGAFGVAAVHAADLEVAALHPLMADLARQVGGGRVTVHDLMGAGADAHRFEPRPADLERMGKSALILACGKGMEPYLDRLRDSLRGIPVVEVGKTIPSLHVGADAVYACCPDHDHEHGHGAGAEDPHWWHGIENTRRAARALAREFAAKDGENAEFYRTNADAYSRRLGELKDWVKTELAKVPRAQRKLVTSHNAFGYFADEFGFEVMAVTGLTAEQSVAPQDLARTISKIREAGVKAVFPEQSHNAKTVDSLAKSAGVILGRPLVSDGNGTGDAAGFEGMVRHNVTAIVDALGAR